jgi:hypothetical protein
MATQTKRQRTKATETRKRTKTTASGAGSTGLKKTAEQLQGIAPVGVKLASSLPVKTAMARLTGELPSRRRAFLAASAAAFAGAVVAYRLLRSGE